MWHEALIQPVCAKRKSTKFRQFSWSNMKEILWSKLLGTKFNEGPTSSFWDFGNSHFLTGFSVSSNIFNTVLCNGNVMHFNCCMQFSSAQFPLVLISWRCYMLKQLYSKKKNLPTLGRISWDALMNLDTLKLNESKVGFKKNNVISVKPCLYATVHEVTFPQQPLYVMYPQIRGSNQSLLSRV